MVFVFNSAEPAAGANSLAVHEAAGFAERLGGASMMRPSVGPVARMPMGSNRVPGDSDGADESLCVCGIFYTLLVPPLREIQSVQPV